MSLLTEKMRQKLTAADIGTVIEVYRQIRDKRDQLKRAMELQSNLMWEIGVFGLDKLAASNVDSVRHNGYTAYKGERQTAVVKDPEEFRQFLADSQRWELLETRASKDQVMAYLEESGGVLPPGVGLNRILSFNVRKA
jgi:hypothetical protein